MDCGIHPGFSGEASLPFLDTIDLDTVDVMLVTHFHLDHCAAVPYVVGRTNFKVSISKVSMLDQQKSGWYSVLVQGRVFMTHPTKAIVGTLLKDFVKVSGGRTDGALYSEKDLEKTLDLTEVIDFHQTIEVDGIQVRSQICLPVCAHARTACHTRNLAVGAPCFTVMWMCQRSLSVLYLHAERFTSGTMVTLSLSEQLSAQVV